MAVLVVLLQSLVELAVGVEVGSVASIADGLGQVGDGVAGEDEAALNLSLVVIAEAVGHGAVGDVRGVDDEVCRQGHGRGNPTATDGDAAMARGSLLVLEARAVKTSVNAVLGRCATEASRGQVRVLVGPHVARDVGHVPQLGAHLLGHLDAVAGVGGAGLQVGVRQLREAGDHVLVGLKATGAQAHAAVGLDVELGAVLLDNDTNHGAGLVGDEALASAALPHGELLVVNASVDGCHAEVVVAGVKAGARGSQAQAVLRLGNLGELVPVVHIAGAAQAPSVVGKNPGVLLSGLHRELVGLVGRADLGTHELGVGAQGVDHPVPVAGSALAHTHEGLFVPVLELAHELGEVAIKLVSVVGGNHELAGSLRVAGLFALGSLLADENRGALLVGGNGGVCASATKTKHDDVVLGIPLHIGGGGVSECGTGDGTHGDGTHGGTLEQIAARNVSTHTKIPFRMKPRRWDSIPWPLPRDASPAFACHMHALRTI